MFLFGTVVRGEPSKSKPKTHALIFLWANSLVLQPGKFNLSRGWVPFVGEMPFGPQDSRRRQTISDDRGFKSVTGASRRQWFARGTA